MLLGLRPEACVGPRMWKQSTICCPLTFPLASGPGAGVPGATSPKGGSHPHPLWGEGNTRRQSCRWAQSLASPQDRHHSFTSGDRGIFVPGSGGGGGSPDSFLLGGLGRAALESSGSLSSGGHPGGRGRWLPGRADSRREEPRPVPCDFVASLLFSSRSSRETAS